MGQRGRSLSRSSDSFDGVAGGGSAQAGGDGEPWRNGRSLSVGGVEGLAGLGGGGGHASRAQ